MVATVLVLGALTALPAAALAKGQGVVYPPGNSGVSQYDEDLPTVHGERATSSVVVPSNGVGSGGSGSASSGVSAGTSGGSVIPHSVIRKLSRDGQAGKAAAALAQATAAGSVPGAKASATQSPKAPATSLVDALTGSTGGGGLGSLFPVLLIGSLVILSLAGIFRRRRSV